MFELNPDYSKRDCSLPPGCKDLIDVIQQREKAKWKTFFDSHRKLTYDIARKAGLTDGEAQEVVQDVIKAVEQQTPQRIYNCAGRASEVAPVAALDGRRTIGQQRHPKVVAAPLQGQHVGRPRVAVEGDYGGWHVGRRRGGVTLLDARRKQP